MDNIVKIQLKGVRELLGERKISLDVPEEAVSWIAEHGYDPRYVLGLVSYFVSHSHGMISPIDMVLDH